MAPVKIFVGSIAVGTSSVELRQLFENYGEVTECDVLGVGNYAFVHMASETEAETAIKELNGWLVNGSQLNVEKSTSATQGRRKKELQSTTGLSGGRGGGRLHKGIPERTTTKIFVGNIKEGTTNEELREIFQSYGEVFEADVIGGFGFVHMKLLSEAIKAIKALNGSYLNGNRLNIELSTEATQGRSHDVTDASASAVTDDVNYPLQGHPLVRGRVRIVGARGAGRFDPYGRTSSVAGDGLMPFQRGSYGAMVADPYATYDPYAVNEYVSDPYADASAVLHPPAVAAAETSSDSFARDLLKLYIKNPVAFDRYAKDPLVQKSLNLNPAEAEEEEDPYYRQSQEYYEASAEPIAASAPVRTLGPDFVAYSGTGYDGSYPAAKQHLMGRMIPVRGRLGQPSGAMGIPKPLIPPPMGARGGIRPGFPRMHPANYYTSFE